MKQKVLYRPKSFDLSGLNGISDQTIEMHFKLYEGYVMATNELTEKISEILEKGEVDQENMPAYSEMKRRLGFEYNGMVLHEHYFGNLKRDGGGDLSAASPFLQRAQGGFGSFETWKGDFINVGKMRGVGWAVCYADPSSGRLSNHWITSHEVGHIAGYRPLLVMDMWEHAFLLDYKPSEKENYIEAFFSNVDWQSVEKRLRSSGRRGFLSVLCKQRETATIKRKTYNESNISIEGRTNNEGNASTKRRMDNESNLFSGNHGDCGRRVSDQPVSARYRER